jgi:hypothetical protein
MSVKDIREISAAMLPDTNCYNILHQIQKCLESETVPDNTTMHKIVVEAVWAIDKPLPEIQQLTKCGNIRNHLMGRFPFGQARKLYLERLVELINKNESYRPHCNSPFCK